MGEWIRSLRTASKYVRRALACYSLSTEEISESLRVAVGTVKNPLSSVFGKLGINSRHQALVFALRHGLVEIGGGRPTAG